MSSLVMRSLRCQWDDVRASRRGGPNAIDPHSQRSCATSFSLDRVAGESFERRLCGVDARLGVVQDFTHVIVAVGELVDAPQQILLLGFREGPISVGEHLFYLSFALLTREQFLRGIDELFGLAQEGYDLGKR